MPGLEGGVGVLADGADLGVYGLPRALSAVSVLQRPREGTRIAPRTTSLLGGSTGGGSRPPTSPDGKSRPLSGPSPGPTAATSSAGQPSAGWTFSTALPSCASRQTPGQRSRPACPRRIRSPQRHPMWLPASCVHYVPWGRSRGTACRIRQGARKVVAGAARWPRWSPCGSVGGLRARRQGEHGNATGGFSFVRGLRDQAGSAR